MKLIAFGANSSGQLGSGLECEYQLPQLIDLDHSIRNKEIKYLSCGGSHTLLLDCDNYLWSTGRNNKGQLGVGSTKSKNKFVKVSSSLNFQKVSAGWDCSAALTADSRLFVWGSNINCQLGFNDQLISNQLTPKELSIPDEWGKPVELKFGLRFATILTDSKRIYITGSLKTFRKPNFLQVVHNKYSSCEYLSLQYEVESLACGQNHLIVSRIGTFSVFGIGENKYYQCEKIAFKDEVKVLQCGWSHNCVLTATGEAFTWGRNRYLKPPSIIVSLIFLTFFQISKSYGQLGNGKKNDFCQGAQKINIDSIEDVSLGSQHGILLAKNKVYTWGWNEHGNCGTGDFEDV